MPAPDPHHQPPGPSTINELFGVMSDESRRQVLYYLRNHGGTADVDELRDHLSKRATAGPDEIGVKLHHSTLPKLDDFDVIEYDRRTDEVQYDGGQLTTDLLEWSGDRERTDG